MPENDKRGRVHSSTVTISVLGGGKPDIDRPASLREDHHFVLEWYSGSGAGGQHRNKHMNSARLKHLPTGLLVTSQQRKRPNSEAAARSDMEGRLDGLLAADGHNAVNIDRSGQIGTGARADKRRTYRFQEGIVVDHVSGRSAEIKKVMRGDFHLLWA